MDVFSKSARHGSPIKSVVRLFAARSGKYCDTFRMVIDCWSIDHGLFSRSLSPARSKSRKAFRLPCAETGLDDDDLADIETTAALLSVTSLAPALYVLRSLLVCA
ncbi:hypothetical protein J3458_005639 [Metarhizium acridum]|uniref:uncharacterized protein n=1 Tax=Metarhizium acridum TaxID=92637 RepID=UPI001C6D154E|nr:hypothetical protein J3458_005639 [Metarhizium acridum]